MFDGYFLTASLINPTGSQKFGRFFVKMFNLDLFKYENFMK